MQKEQFIKECDYHLRQGKIPKAKRNKMIGEWLLDENEWPEKLEFAQGLNMVDVPLESEEQKQFVSWFKEKFPDDVVMMIRNDGFRTFSERAEQKLMGQHNGASDLELPRWNIYLEMKRQKGWRQSEEQKAFERYIVDVCGKHYILGLGFEDAKEKVLKVINSNE